MPDAPKSSRRTLLVLGALFLVPLAAAFLLWKVGWRPTGSSINGELLQPFKQMPQGSTAMLKGDGSQPHNWAIFYVGDGRCDEDCKQALVFARQTRLSLGKDMTRVNRAFVALANCCDLAYIDKEQQGTKVYDVSDEEASKELLEVLPADELRHWLFVVDPLGNIVMRYDVRGNPRGMLDDLKKLLQLSHIG